VLGRHNGDQCFPYGGVKRLNKRDLFGGSVAGKKVTLQQFNELIAPLYPGILGTAVFSRIGPPMAQETYHEG
jgi:hypothetical protein